MQAYFLGIDVGSTAVKIAIISEGVSLYQNSGKLLTYHGENGAKYQQASEVLQVVEQLILELPADLRKKVKAIGFSVAMHSLMPLVAGQFQELFLWSDQQATSVLSQLPQEMRETFYLRSGTPIHPMSPFAKILYFQQRMSYPSGTSWWGLKELLMVHFTGEVAIDVATASATGLCSLATGDWDDDILRYLGISRQQLAPIVPANQKFTLTNDCQRRYGLGADVAVFCGGSDGCLAAYAGLATTGLANSLTIGTSGALRAIGSEVKLDSLRQNFCYRLTETLVVTGGPSNNGGNVLAWASQIFGEATNFYDELPAVLATTEIGANGVKFYPFLSGERAPYWDAQLTGGFQNLRITTKRRELIRSVLEGLLLNLRSLKPAIIGNGPVSFSGGFFETPELAQLAVDILGNPAILSKENEPIFGLYALLFGEKSTAAAPNSQQLIVPNPVAQVAYERLHRDYFADLEE
ncbi:gluconokinase [Enterococcus diestrammenae]|uniref:Gluconokinase n=1 Tax=Enterococcus diestrammenae TaxID=1155073 RepID=A0ABV0F4K2_9ENTE|nr:FGGY family carbohydrate kinase [Enterococcus diestrammenae]KAF1295455.1 hypothetical protein BAU18_02395 [Enterococcus diestrammenae]